MRVIVTTVPFGEIDARPRALLEEAGIEYAVNPLGRRLKPEEVSGVIDGYDIVVAGTEKIAAEAMNSPKLKAICRVGIGLDSVDLSAARRRGIAVSYTPEGPSPAVAELAVGQIINLLRGVSLVDKRLRTGTWYRQFGGRVSHSTIGIVGCGRIGSRVIGHLLGGFPGVRILANDIRNDLVFPGSDQVEWADFETVLTKSDVVSMHVPLNQETRGMIGPKELSWMKSTASLINTARGGVVDELALVEALTANRIASAALDVFEDEPYAGPLIGCENVVLTCHMGSMTRDCRTRMEVEAVEDAVRFAAGKSFLSPVPEFEFEQHARAEMCRQKGAL